MLLADKVFNLLFSSLNPECCVFHHWYSAFPCDPLFDHIRNPAYKFMHKYLMFCVLNAPHCKDEIIQIEYS